MAEFNSPPIARQQSGVWRQAIGTLLVFSLLFVAAQPVAADPNWQQRHAEAKKIVEPGEQVAFLSEGFLGLPYVDSPLVGSATQSERLINDLTRIDCFTLLDFVETLRRAPNLKEFDRHLLKVRYRNGKLSYPDRHHFFSAWGKANHPQLRNVTLEITETQAGTLEKILNRKQNGEPWLQGLPEQKVTLRYLPTQGLNGTTQAQLQTGDYLGIVTSTAGLDVSHTGILIRKNGTLFLRHASSRPETRQVLDEPLLPYLQGKLGLLVFRPQ